VEPEPRSEPNQFTESGVSKQIFYLLRTLHCTLYSTVVYTVDKALEYEPQPHKFSFSEPEPENIKIMLLRNSGKNAGPTNILSPATTTLLFYSLWGSLNSLENKVPKWGVEGGMRGYFFSTD
jgi:hypothetical protein